MLQEINESKTKASRKCGLIYAFVNDSKLDTETKGLVYLRICKSTTITKITISISSSLHLLFPIIEKKNAPKVKQKTEEVKEKRITEKKQIFTGTYDLLNNINEELDPFEEGVFEYPFNFLLNRDKFPPTFFLLEEKEGASGEIVYEINTKATIKGKKGPKFLEFKKEFRVLGNSSSIVGKKIITSIHNPSGCCKPKGRLTVEGEIPKTGEEEIKCDLTVNAKESPKLGVEGCKIKLMRKVQMKIGAEVFHVVTDIYSDIDQNFIVTPGSANMQKLSIPDFITSSSALLPTLSYIHNDNSALLLCSYYLSAAYKYKGGNTYSQEGNLEVFHSPTPQPLQLPDLPEQWGGLREEGEILTLGALGIGNEILLKIINFK